MSNIQEGQKVSVHYIGKLDDGTEFDNTRFRGQPLSFEIGAGQIIAGFDQALRDMNVGETKNIQLSPEEAYGKIFPDRIHPIPRESFPPEFVFEIGKVVQGQNELGQPVLATVTSFEESSVMLDFNHPLAGKNLNFEIELLSVE